MKYDFFGVGEGDGAFLFTWPYLFLDRDFLYFSSFLIVNDAFARAARYSLKSPQKKTKKKKKKKQGRKWHAWKRSQ